MKFFNFSAVVSFLLISMSCARMEIKSIEEVNILDGINQLEAKYLVEKEVEKNKIKLCKNSVLFDPVDKGEYWKIDVGCSSYHDRYFSVGGNGTVTFGGDSDLDSDLDKYEYYIKIDKLTGIIEKIGG